jgi:hypothetical protein
MRFTPSLASEADIGLPSGHAFNPVDGEPALPEHLRISGYPEGTSGYYIVQFSGPVSSDWRNEIERRGGRVVAYLPHQAFIVKLDDVARLRVMEFSPVRWIGIYQPAYKLHPRLSSALGMQELSIQLFREEDGQAVISRLLSLGGEITKDYSGESVPRVRIRIDAAAVSEIASLIPVVWIEPYVPPEFDNNEAQWIMQTHFDQNRRIWSIIGIRGEGELITSCDSGIYSGHNMFNDLAVPITTWGNYPDHRKIVAYIQSDPAANFGDGGGAYWHGTHTSCSMLGDDSLTGGTSAYDGMALKARTFYMDGGSNSDIYVHPGPASTLYGTPYAGNDAGAPRVMSNSWGSNGTGFYDEQCVEADDFMWSHKDFLILFSNSNEGPGYRTTGSPAAAKNVISVGAVDGAIGQNLMGFSSRGPAADGRIKPTVVAPGVIHSAEGPTPTTYREEQGTSMSTPVLAGNALLIRQYLREGWYPTGVKDTTNAFAYVSAALIKAMIVNSAVNDIYGFTVPDSAIGWGRPCLDSVLYFSGDTKALWLYDDTLGLETGEYLSYTIPVVSTTAALTFSLVWTDYPGVPGANPALVNDLNLEVLDPFGTPYKGNVYFNGQSITGGSFDALNVEENVRRNTPFAGIWTVRVYGQNVPYGPQPYALVVTGGLSSLPYLRIGDQILDDTALGNGDGQIDPGETFDLTLELRNTGNQASVGTVGKLRTDSPYVTILDSTSDYGTIANPGASAGDVFTVEVPDTIPTGYTIPLELHVSANGDSVQTALYLSLLVNRFDTYDLDPGNVLLTVTKLGTIGVLAPGDAGNGFHYPRDNSRDLLYQGSFFLGNDSSYVMDRYGSSADWVATTNPDGRLRVYFHGDSLVTVSGSFCDSGAVNPRGLLVEQSAEARSGALLGDMVLLKYRFRNNGAAAVEDLYAALFADFDVYTDLGWSTNLAFVDTSRQLAFVKWGTYNPLAGICALGPDRAATWSVIDNTLYAPGKEFPDSNKIRFLNGSLQVLSGTMQKDWSALVSHGPFSLAPGETDSVAYAVIGATNLGDLQVRADSARSSFGWEWTSVEEGTPDEPMPSVLALFQNEPNPVGNGTRIRYALGARGRTTLALYNVAGQLVRTVVDEIQNPGPHAVEWNGRDSRGEPTANGVYFYRLTTPERSLTRRMVVIR